MHNEESQLRAPSGVCGEHQNQTVSETQNDHKESYTGRGLCPSALFTCNWLRFFFVLSISTSINLQVKLKIISPFPITTQYSFSVPSGGCQVSLVMLLNMQFRGDLYKVASSVIQSFFTGCIRKRILAEQHWQGECWNE